MWPKKKKKKVVLFSIFKNNSFFDYINKSHSGYRYVFSELITRECIYLHHLQGLVVEVLQVSVVVAHKKITVRSSVALV